MGIENIKKAQTLWNEIFQHLANREENRDPNDKCITIHREAFDTLISDIAKNFHPDSNQLIKLINNSAWKIPDSSYYSLSTIARALYHKAISSTNQKEQFHYRTHLPQLLFAITRELRFNDVTAIEVQLGFLYALAEHRPQQAAEALPEIIKQAQEHKENTPRLTGIYNSEASLKRQAAVLAAPIVLQKLQQSLAQEHTATPANTEEEDVAPASPAHK